MGNPAQRDTVQGLASSASAEKFRARRQGNLTRASDGFRAPTLPPEPRRPTWGRYEVDPPNAPYHYNPASPASGKPFDVPRTFAYLRAPSLGAPRVGFPEEQRTRGRLQASGEAWGKFGERQRPVLTPPRDGGPPTHELGEFKPGRTSALGPRWTPPTSPKIYRR